MVIGEKKDEKETLIVYADFKDPDKKTAFFTDNHLSGQCREDGS